MYKTKLTSPVGEIAHNHEILSVWPWIWDHNLRSWSWTGCRRGPRGRWSAACCSYCGRRRRSCRRTCSCRWSCSCWPHRSAGSICINWTTSRRCGWSAPWILTSCIGWPITNFSIVVPMQSRLTAELDWMSMIADVVNVTLVFVTIIFSLLTVLWKFRFLDRWDVYWNQRHWNQIQLETFMRIINYFIPLPPPDDVWHIALFGQSHKVFCEFQCSPGPQDCKVCVPSTQT